MEPISDDVTKAVLESELNSIIIEEGTNDHSIEWTDDNNDVIQIKHLKPVGCWMDEIILDYNTAVVFGVVFMHSSFSQKVY